MRKIMFLRVLPLLKACGITFAIWLVVIYANAQAVPDGNVLKQIQDGIQIKITQHDSVWDNKVVAESKLASINSLPVLTVNEAQWQVTKADIAKVQGKDAIDVQVNCKLTKGASPQTKITIEIELPHWNVDNYVIFPATVYAGNRFNSLFVRYPPQRYATADIGINAPILISDVPRLRNDNGVSGIYERSGAMAFPSVAYFDPTLKKSVILLTPQQIAREQDYGLGLTENANRNGAKLILSGPVVKELSRYEFEKGMKGKSIDKAPTYRSGDEINLTFRIYVENCQGVENLFAQLTLVRNDLVPDNKLPGILPFSASFDIIQKKYNKESWQENYKFYGSEDGSIRSGWGSGMMQTFPFLVHGDSLTKKRSYSTINRFFPSGMTPSGFIADIYSEGAWHGYGGQYSKWARREYTKDWHLIRRSSDVLYYTMKHLILAKSGKAQPMPEAEDGAKKMANAFVKLWNTYKQTGQFVNRETGEMMVGQSTSAGISPAGLAMASAYFNQKEYLDAAIAIGNYFYNNYTSKGLTCGAAGDAMQNPDSESSYAIVVTYTSLYNYTHDPLWLQRATAAANQFLTWVVSYNYKFPSSSLFERLNMHTTGSVYANSQNKHSAPGICAHSGIALFHLYRATGDTLYLNVLRDIACGLPQYLSRPDRKIKLQHDGWISERVQMNDWQDDVPIGEIHHGAAAWCETALLMTYTELPGLYVRPDDGFYKMIDNMDITQVRKTKGKLLISVKNPTDYPGKLKIFSEKKSDLNKPLDELFLYDCRQELINPGETKVLTFKM